MTSYIPKIEYNSGPTQVLFSIGQRWWETEEGADIGDEDMSAAGIPISYVVLYSYGAEITIRFTDSEKPDVMTWVEHMIKNKNESFDFWFDAQDDDTKYSFYLEDPKVGARARPRRDTESPWCWSLSLRCRSLDGRVHVPILDTPIVTTLEVS